MAGCQSDDYNCHRMRHLLHILACIALAGCGSSNCNNLTYTLHVTQSVTPAGGPNHAAPPPGNQEQFTATLDPDPKTGCVINFAVPRALAAWTVSDPKDITTSSAKDDTNGLATCLHATAQPATVTASYPQNGMTQTASTTMSCK
jgi:hypothetical protein